MKADIHPTDYRPVVVQDTSTGFKFLTRMSVKTDKTIKWDDGQDYPLVEVYISSDSHPYYTGKETLIDTEGRVDRFKARTAAAAARKEALANKAKKAAARVTAKNDDAPDDK